MGKILLMVILACSSSIGAMQKLDPVYQVTYGNPKAPVKIIEYFSLNCTQCLRFFNDDFPIVKTKYLDSDQVLWSFHPDPADLLTLQFMVCLDHLEEDKRGMFLYVMMKMLDEKIVKEAKHTEKQAILMQKIMKELGHPIEELQEMPFLMKTKAFQSAYAFLKQKDVVQSIPTVEINGILQDEYPSLNFLDKKINSLMPKKRSS